MPLQPKIPYESNNCKIVFRIKTPTKTLTETHWSGQQGVDAIPAVMDEAKAVGTLRHACLAAKCHIDQIIVSCPGFPRNTATDKSLSKLAATTASPENVGNDCAHVLMRGTDLYRTHIYIGGVPDAAIDASGPDKGVKGTFQARLEKFLTEGLIAKGWGWMPIEKDPALAPRTKILYVRAEPVVTPIPSIKTATPHGIEGSHVLVRVSRVPGATKALPINQLQFVDVVDATTLWSPSMPGPTEAITLKGGGTVQEVYYSFQPYTTFALRADTTRRRGIRIGAPLGRRKFKRTTGY